MSKLLIEMEMPTRCGACKCRHVEFDIDRVAVFCEIKDNEYVEDPDSRPSWCPIIGELPDEHGDLIDRDKAIFEMCEGLAPKGYRAWAKRYLKSEKINPTVIAAERRANDEADN